MQKNTESVIRRAFILLIFCLFHLQTAYALDVNGVISTDNRWSKADSPVNITGNVRVATSATLTIDPGVVVKFWNGTDQALDDKFSITIEGQLMARGTASDPIRFTSSRKNPKPGDWNHIEFTRTAVEAELDENGNYLSGSIFEYVTVEYGGGDEKSPIFSESSLYFKNSTFQNNNSGAIYSNAKTLSVNNSTFTNTKRRSSQISCIITTVFLNNFHHPTIAIAFHSLMNRLYWY